MAADDNQPMSFSSPVIPGAPASEPPSPAYEGACRLQDWGVMLATGTDCASFLHGQLTQDMIHLSEGQARLAGYCSAKGRLLATFTVWPTGPEQLMLACSADLLAPTLKRLSMFVLRAKCKLTDGSSDFPLYGLCGPQAEQWLQATAAKRLPTEPWAVLRVGPAFAVKLPSAVGVSRWLLAQPAEMPMPPLSPLPRSAWDWLEVRAGVVRVVAATVEQFVPQMVNLEVTGGVSFQKGCYPGQEVVARSQYRGTLKRRMWLASSDAAVVPGQEVHHSSDPSQPAGMVVLAAPVPGDGSGRHAALVECKTALTVVSGQLTAGRSVLGLEPLPYPLPSDTA